MPALPKAIEAPLWPREGSALIYVPPVPRQTVLQAPVVSATGHAEPAVVILQAFLQAAEALVAKWLPSALACRSQDYEMKATGQHAHQLIVPVVPKPTPTFCLHMAEVQAVSLSMPFSRTTAGLNLLVDSVEYN